jgi:metal-responsive CopG/Arc/MetJ family transcriptional regulator
MSEESKDPDVQVKLTIPQALADEIDRVMNGFYKYRQEYILEAVREKIKHDLAEKEVTA